MSVKDFSANLKAEKKAKNDGRGGQAAFSRHQIATPVAEYVSAKVEMHTAQETDKSKSR